MAKFRVFAKSIGYVYLDVEAENVHHAIDPERELLLQKKEEADGGDFHEDGGGWEFLDDVMELEEDAAVDYEYSDFFGN